MYIESILIKNFLSYGEVPTTYQFDRHNMTMISAINGSGKSSIIDALTFVLFGKSFRDIKKDLLINTTNKKNSIVECKLIGNNGKKVLVKRGLKPGIFEIYEDGVLVNQDAESRDYQAYLESNILGMNFITFSQTVIISKTRYTPFMRLKAGERRSFVESVLNLKIFGTMQKLQSKNLSALKNTCSDIKMDIRVQENNESNKIESLRKLISLKKSASDDAKEQNQNSINDLQSKITLFTDKINECESNIDNTDYSKKVELYERLIDMNNSYRSNAERVVKDIKKAKSTKDTCFTCGSKVDISHIEGHVKELMAELNEYKEKVGLTKEKIELLKPTYELYIQQSSNNRVLKNNISNYKYQIEDLNENINQLTNKKFDSSKYDIEIESSKKDIVEIKNDLKKLNDDLQAILIDIDNNELALTLLKDSGIKSSIIQDSIPSINKIIGDYLYKFGFYINFVLDSEFNETIYQRGVNHLIYNNFSEGEKLRIDLSLILAWREIALLKNGTSCNLLFFDEIADASMDSDGVELFAKALSSLKNTNVWIITHAPAKLENYVRGYIQLDKIDGFTVINNNR